ncbi:MAG TPA: lysylphosphatidylglycerol synthase transmembrane domain-containing protein [Nocardioidaceae bacterium]|nr:lysylphosphatidylglycerol synthase transmembrane domain-containing protein [Nocardioidaceae bacterium]
MHSEPERHDSTRQRSARSLSIGRHPGDAARLLVAAVVVTACCLLALPDDVNTVESAIFVEIQRLPRPSAPLWAVLTWVGSWAGIAVTTALALYLNRFRLAAALAATGVAGWFTARVIGWAIGTREMFSLLAENPAVRAPAAGFGFPSGHTAVAAALTTTVGPYLNRTSRSLTWAGVVLVGVADVYRGTHLPLGVFAGAFLGWGIGTVSHLVLGAPRRRTSGAGIVHALETAGMEGVDLVPVRHSHLFGPLTFEASTSDGQRLEVEVVRRLRRRAGPFYKLRRLVASLEVEDEPRLSTPLHEVEHQAFVTLLAERAGVRTPSVVMALRPEHMPALVVHRRVEGRRLSDLEPGQIGDDLVRAVWQQVHRLGVARIAHHDLRAKNILVDEEEGPWLLDFVFARAGASRQRLAQDIAEVMTSIASRVGAERAVAGATAVLPRRDLAAALPYLQPLALPRRIRTQLNQADLLLELRDVLAARIDSPVPSFRSPVRPSTLAFLVVGGLAVYVLVPQLSSMRAVLTSLRGADIGWLVVTVLLGLAALLPQTLSILGSTRTSLPWWRALAVQVAAAFTGRTTPGGVGYIGLNVVFLERCGVRRPQAVGAMALNRAATLAVSAAVCVIAVLALGSSGVAADVSLPTGWPVLIVVVVVLVIAGLVIGSPFGRRRIVHPTVEVAREMASTLHDPRRAAQLVGGTVGFLGLMALGQVTSLAALGTDFAALPVLGAYMVGVTIGQLAPTPGSLGAVEAALVAALTAIDVASTSAVAAVLTARLLTFWLPIIPGVVVLRYLQHHGMV